MCGIVGLYDMTGRPAETDAVDRMVATIRHRGPDSQGTYSDGPVAMGMTRLAIIDLSPAAHQPMSNEDGTVYIVYNGEVYNHRDLRRELEHRGHKYRSLSDTETVLHAYEEYGSECVHRLRGMFGFAVWDARNRTLFLARDRLGIKPLYYAQTQDQFVFASEIKAILHYPGFQRRVNIDAINDYLAFRVVPEPQTAFQGISALLPGHVLECSGSGISIRQYWDVPPPSEGPPKPLSYYSERLLDEVTEAVESHLISDVPLGAFLSGGIDSSAIVGLMAQATKGRVKTFCVGFEGQERRFDERDDARHVANYFGAEHHEMVVRSEDVLRDLPKLIWSFGQPAATPIPNYYVSQFAKKDVTVALSGLGADELFAGYPRHVGFRLAELYQRVPEPLRRATACLIERLPGSTDGREWVRRSQKFVRGVELSAVHQYAQWALFFSEETKDRLYRDSFAGSLQAQTLTALSTYFDQRRLYAFPDRVLYVDVKTYLPNDLLIYADRMSMAHSLELRVPFLDHKLVEFAAGIPYGLKLRGFTGKYVLREALRRLLPSSVLKKPKQGFVFPMGLWLRRDWRDMVASVLSEENVNKRGYFNYPAIQELLSKHNSEVRDYTYEIWALVVLELWHQRFIDKLDEPAQTSS